MGLDGKTVLVVDDEPDMRDLLQASLELSGGCRVVLAKNLEEGLAQARAHRPDLALLDVMMPGGDGRELLVRLRSELGLTDMPVFFVTTRAGVEHVAEYAALGAQGVITKPFDPIELPERLSAYFRPPEPRRSRLEVLRQRYGSRLPEKLDHLLELIAGALEERRPEAAQREAHKIAGSAGSYGFPKVSVIARDIERAFLAEDGPDWAAVASRSDALRELREGLAATPSPAEQADSEDD